MKLLILLFMKLLILLLLPVFSSAQSFSVSGYDTYSVNKVTEKIRSEGYQIVDSSKADYIVFLIIDGEYHVMSLKRGFSGYISIIDRSTRKEISRSKMQKGTPTAFNGYNASYSIFSKLEKKYLPGELKKCTKK